MRTGSRAGPLQGLKPEPQNFGAISRVSGCAHWFSRRTSSSSSGAKSLGMLNVFRISSGVLPVQRTRTRSMRTGRDGAMHLARYVGRNEKPAPCKGGRGGMTAHARFRV